MPGNRFCAARRRAATDSRFRATHDAYHAYRAKGSLMRNYLCWDPSEARRVMNPFAEHIPDSLFRAIHSDWVLQVSPPVGTSFQQITTASFTQMSPEDLLADFLRED